MSMVTLTVIQLVGIFCAYLFVSVGLPAFVFGRKMRGHRAPERFMLYFMIGNFYMMNLVFALQLLKISSPLTLILGTLIPAVAARVVINRIPVLKMAVDFTNNVRKVSGGQMGGRTAVHKTARAAGRQLARFGKWIGYFLVHRFFDCVLVAALFAVMWWMYGQNLIRQFGYKASDLLVHNYWINALNENHIFVAGVYPHGFHCVIYYLHAVFGIETFVLLRVFAFVQNVMLHLMLLCFLRLCCKTKYAAYTGTFGFVLANFFRANTYARYYATLPQEFGIIFILPAVYFGFAYFETRRRELAQKVGETGKRTKRQRKRLFRKRKEQAAPVEDIVEEKETPLSLAEIQLEEIDCDELFREPEAPAPALPSEKKGRRRRRKAEERLPKGRRRRRDLPPSWMCLAGFCMSFSMTLAVHFYGTMIAGIFCMAMALGYGFLFFQKKYFWNVIVTGILSVTVAVLPMLIAFLGGTPLQGSLGWGMNIIMGTDGKEEEAEETESQTDAGESAAQGEASQGGTSQGGTQGGAASEGASQDAASQNMASQGTEGTPPVAVEAPPRPGLGERIAQLPEKIAGFGRIAWRDIYNSLNGAVFVMHDSHNTYWVMRSFFALIAMGAVYFLFRRRCYGAMLMSTGLYMLFLCVLMASGTFKLPALMDSNRGSIYFSYSLPVALSFLLDSVLYLPVFALKNKAARVGRFLMNFLSLACVVGSVYYIVTTDHLRTPRNPQGQEINEAVTCLTSIIRGEEDFSWTIVSANDELRMGWDHGYHYETITFLHDMEGANPSAMIRIPTRVVYFFIEKIPIDYNVAYENSGQAVSTDGANQPLPANQGIGMYQGEKRWIVMSRMYYWAQAFLEMYPDEMETYMETENFVCYRIEQNPYRLYNFAINYIYNSPSYDVEE